MIADEMGRCLHEKLPWLVDGEHASVLREWYLLLQHHANIAKFGDAFRNVSGRTHVTGATY